MKFRVLLNITTPACFEVYGGFGEKLAVNGHTFLHISCDQLVSDAHYLQVRLSEPSTKLGLLVWIPHHYVVLVIGDDQDRKVGFVPA